MAGITPISDRLLAPQTAAVPSAAKAAEQDLWIFRDGKRNVRGPDLVEDLRRRIAGVSDAGALLDALIEAGELEAALADAGSESAERAARVTNHLAAAVIAGEQNGAAGAVQLLEAIAAPATVCVAPPEGFTYYALHPNDFVQSAMQLSAESSRYAIIGIRSIGTTLSAVVLGALTAQAKETSRISVRPTGHPYSRKTHFNTGQLRWIEENRGAQFLVVDEGPGRSGSTFLAVAEALLHAGVPRQDITMMGSRQPDLGSLCADNAADRWREFRFLATTPSVNHRFECCTYIGGGYWRQLMLAPEEWPESWTQMERLKFLSPDSRTLYKFEGMGPMGAEVRRRAAALAEAGFGPRLTDAGDGFLAYDFLPGTRPRVQRTDAALLDRIAEYLAFRHAEFKVQTWAETSQLREMLEFNVSQEFGIDFRLPEEAFCTDQPVVTDGRMQPYEWILSHENLFKTDGVDHGDNHFFPGPCDIAWDLAGTAVEWRLERDAIEYLAAQFRAGSGVDVSARLDAYRLGYSVFRLGFCKMAMSTVNGTPEEERIRAAYERYRSYAEELLVTISTKSRAA